MSEPLAQRRGCLAVLTRLALTLALACVLVLVIAAVFTPWGFFLGGHFHVFPYWQGWGMLRGKSGKYGVFVDFGPWQSGSRVIVTSGLKGNGYLCSPRGEISRLILGGSMRRGLPLNTDGENISLSGGYRPLFFGNLRSFSGPGIKLHGRWQNPRIVMDEESTISASFNPDGTFYFGEGPKPQVIKENGSFTLAPGSYSDFEAACKQH